MPKPNIIIQVAGKNLSLPLPSLFWKAWCVLTYPTLIFLGYEAFGMTGILFTAGLLILTNRGKL